MSLVFGLGLVLTGVADAHDYYLELSSLQVEPGESATVHGVIAHQTEREQRHLRPVSLQRLDLVAGGVITSVVPEEGAPEAAGSWGSVSRTSPGIVSVIYANTEEASVSLEHEAFLQYVWSEGDDRHVYVIDAFPGAFEPPVHHEHNRRSLKVMLQVGGRAKGYDIPAGLPLELIPAKSPFGRNAKKPMSFQLLEEGRPAEGVRVRAFPAVGDALRDAHKGRTDDEGRVSFVLPERKGGWVIAAVTMTHALDRPEPWHWHSTWTSLRLP
jgi:hypothetical protein